MFDDLVHETWCPFYRVTKHRSSHGMSRLMQAAVLCVTIKEGRLLRVFVMKLLIQWPARGQQVNR